MHLLHFPWENVGNWRFPQNITVMHDNIGHNNSKQPEALYLLQVSWFEYKICMPEM